MIKAINKYFNKQIGNNKIGIEINNIKIKLINKIKI